jgi:flagellar basal body rod protein FlgB
VTTDARIISSPPEAAAVRSSRSEEQWPLRNPARGNSVTHEDEMMKVAGNQMDFEAVTSLYTHSLAMIKLAIGK